MPSNPSHWEVLRPTAALGSPRKEARKGLARRPVLWENSSWPSCFLLFPQHCQRFPNNGDL